MSKPNRTIFTLILDSADDLAIRALTDTITEDPNAHIYSKHKMNVDYSSFDWQNDRQFDLPMSLADVRGFTSQRLSALVEIATEDYFHAVAGLGTAGTYTPENLVHDSVLDFGEPHNATLRIMAADPDTMLIHYSTDLQIPIDQKTLGRLSPRARGILEASANLIGNDRSTVDSEYIRAQVELIADIIDATPELEADERRDFIQRQITSKFD